MALESWPVNFNSSRSGSSISFRIWKQGLEPRAAEFLGHDEAESGKGGPPVWSSGARMGS